VANRYPYVASAGPLLRTIDHLRRSFPKEVTADTLRKLGVAPKNESYVINVLRFLGVIDDEGKPVEDKKKAFLLQDDAFSTEFETLVRDSYEELFELYSDGAWDLERADLTQFFRTSDHSTEVVGKRQAATFVALSGLAGHGSLPGHVEGSPATRTTPAVRKRKTKDRGAKLEADNAGKTPRELPERPQFGLTVRVEVNLPAEGDQATYDRIFRSIRKNLIDGD